MAQVEKLLAQAGPNFSGANQLFNASAGIMKGVDNKIDNLGSNSLGIIDDKLEKREQSNYDQTLHAGYEILNNPNNFDKKTGELLVPLEMAGQYSGNKSDTRGSEKALSELSSLAQGMVKENQKNIEQSRQFQMNYDLNKSDKDRNYALARQNAANDAAYKAGLLALQQSSKNGSSNSGWHGNGDMNQIEKNRAYSALGKGKISDESKNFANNVATKIFNGARSGVFNDLGIDYAGKGFETFVYGAIADLAAKPEYKGWSKIDQDKVASDITEMILGTKPNSFTDVTISLGNSIGFNLANIPELTQAQQEQQIQYEKNQEIQKQIVDIEKAVSEGKIPRSKADYFISKMQQEIKG